MRAVWMDRTGRGGTGLVCRLVLGCTAHNPRCDRHDGPCSRTSPPASVSGPPRTAPALDRSTMRGTGTAGSPNATQTERFERSSTPSDNSATAQRPRPESSSVRAGRRRSHERPTKPPMLGASSGEHTSHCRPDGGPTRSMRVKRIAPTSWRSRIESRQ